MSQKIPNYMYRDHDKNSSNSSSGCEEDFSFETDDNYVNDVDDTNETVMFSSSKHNYNNHIEDIFTNVDEMKSSTTATATAALNLSPLPHFPPPPDYPPPNAMSVSRTQTQPRSRYYYYENGINDVNCMRRRVGSLDRDCSYAMDEMYGSGYQQSPQQQHQLNGQNSINGSNRSTNNGKNSANNSFSSSSSCSNSSVVMYNKNKKVAPAHAQIRFSPVTIKQNPNELDCTVLYEQQQQPDNNNKRNPFKSHSSSASSTASATSKSTKNTKNKIHHDTLRSINGDHSISAAEIYEQNSIQVGGSAASFAREAKFLTNVEPQVKWIRNNIAATMERFQPSPSTSKPNGSGNEHVYQQIEDSPRSQYEFNHLNATAGPSKPPPPNSIRALLLTANRKNAYKMSPTMRHVYTTRYGTQENIYEEISSEERLRLLTGGHSMLSLHQPSSVEEEFRRVQSRHRRILGELNLSVEAMLMPSTPPNDSPVAEADAHQTATSSSTTCLNELLNVVGPTDELLSPISVHASNAIADIDSGFSGSSSSGGASSYLGSLRYKNGLPTRSSTPNGHHSSGSSCRSSQRSNEDPGILMISSRSTSLYGNGVINHGTIGVHTIANVNRYRSAEDPGPNVLYKDGKVIATPGKASFWSRKSWRKFPGFSSNTSVNKAGINHGKGNALYLCDDV